MKQIAIVGLGIIGGSFAKALANRLPGRYKVSAIDINQDTLDEAKKLGFIEKGETTNKSILQNADIVIIALYPNLVTEFVVTHQEDFKEGALIVETSGIKKSIMQELLPLIPEQIEFIFGHPMAGRESQGFAFADDRVFLHANYVITPSDKNKAASIEFFSQLLKDLGFGRITISSPKTHDLMIAYTSQLTHLIAAALINSDSTGQNTVEFIGDSFRELTRIAKMNEKLWSELMLNNREPLLEVIESFEKQLANLKQAILTNDKEALEQEFIHSTQKRLALESADQAHEFAKERGK